MPAYGDSLHLEKSMVTSGKLAATVSAATGVSEATVLLVIRNLREAGLLTSKRKAGRGYGAAAVTPLDASTVLTVLLVSEFPASAAKAATDFGQLERAGWKQPKLNVSPYGFQLQPKDGKTFSENLAAVLTWLSTMPEEFTILPPQITVSATIGDLTARIDIPSMTYEYLSPILSDLANKKTNDPQAFYALRDAYRGSRIRREFSFNQAVLVPVAAEFRVPKGETTNE
jgi:hypothetical protein